MVDHASPDISGLIGMYSQGNEPNHHTPYLYAYAGQQWKTAEKIRQIDREFLLANRMVCVEMMIVVR